MTKAQEQAIIKRLEELERAVIKLQEQLELNKLNRPTYTVAEASKILGVTPKTVYLMIERGELESVKLGHTRIKGNSLRAGLGM